MLLLFESDSDVPDTFKIRASLGGAESLNGMANSATRNLPLAAHPCVGHIGLNGAVAEWLKAAVC